jgi:uncharacterized membrane protein
MESNKRSIAKAISWRIVGTIATGVIGYILTGSMVVASSLMSIDFVIKFILYYLHERAWNKITILK